MKTVETIRKVKNGYRLYSNSGKNLGTYSSMKGAKKREREARYERECPTGK